jgi:hypothetical protein
VSAYTEIKTEFRDLESLITALCEVGTAQCPTLRRDQIEIHPNGANLVGYHGDTRLQRAHVIVRRHNVNVASNDIGFELVNGAYVARISSYDSNAHGQPWLNKVAQRANLATVKRNAAQRGYKVKETANADGSLRLVLAR